MYFDQQTGALHPKFFCVKTSFFIFFCHERGKKKIDRKGQKITRKTSIKGGLPIFSRSQPAFGCQPAFKSYAGRPPLMHVFLIFCAFLLIFFHFLWWKIWKKLVLTHKQMILTRDWHAEHLFAGQNAQHLSQGKNKS